MSYALTPDDTIKASYQQGFRTADVTYWRWWLAFDQAQTTAGLKGLPDLKPETVESYELNYRKEMSEKKYAFDTSLYYNQYRDALLWHYFAAGDGFVDAAGVAANVAAQGWSGGSFLNTHGTFASVGGELAAEIKATSNIKGRASYAYSRPAGVGGAEVESGWTTADHRHRWRTFPTHIVKLSVTGAWLDKKLITEVNGQYYDAVSGANSEVTTPAVDVYGTPRFIVNASVRYAFTQKLSVRLIGENLGANAVPSVGSAPSRPWGGSVGYSDRRGYLEGVYKF
jgi:outer membrane receptor for ferrienterochelin and colicin